MSDIKLPLKKSPIMLTNYLSTKIIHVTNITPKPKCHARKIRPLQTSDDLIKRKFSFYFAFNIFSRIISNTFILFIK